MFRKNKALVMSHTFCRIFHPVKDRLSTAARSFATACFAASPRSVFCGGGLLCHLAILEGNHPPVDVTPEEKMKSRLVVRSRQVR